MYHFVVRQQLKRAFAHINAGRYDAVLAVFTPDHEHTMLGEHCLSGQRRSAARTTAWYARLARLLPALRFELHDIVVAGWPWRTRAFVSWSDHFPLPGGGMGGNRGVHEIELRWGKVTRLLIHCDTQRLARYCTQFAQAGLDEALAAPIQDGPVPWGEPGSVTPAGQAR